jgi:glycosyltransferase involved in cell wall biosynthesis
MLCWAFPPDAQVGALRVARFCKYLPEFGIEPIVLTMQDRFRQSIDKSLPAITGLRIERTEIEATPLDWYRRSKTLLRPQQKTPAATTTAKLAANPPAEDIQKGFLRRQLLALLQISGSESGWYGPALRAGKKLIHDESIGAVFSSSPPTVSHRVALSLKREQKIPWIADFRDPWIASFELHDKPSWWRGLSQKTESACMRGADRVICNTDRMRQGFLAGHPDVPRQKFQTVTNGFEDIVPPTAHEKPQGRKLFLHLGNIYGERRIDTFCSAIEGLVANQKLDPSAFQIVFLGNVEPSLLATARNAAPKIFESGCIEFRPRVERRMAEATLWSADLLLLFQGAHHLQIPAKFHEYLLTGRPIFAITEEGALSDVLDDTSAGIWVAPDNVEQIAAKFLQALALPTISPEAAREHWYQKFHYRALTEQLATCFFEVANQPR